MLLSDDGEELTACHIVKTAKKVEVLGSFMNYRTMSQTGSETMKRLKTTQILDNICELNDKQRQLHATQNDWQLDTNRLVT